MAMTQEARKRRLQDTLIIAGGGVIAFSAWSLAKTALFMIMTEDDKLRQLLAINADAPMIIVWVVVLIVLGVDLIIRAYVGLSARAEGRGKKKGIFYLIVAVFAAIANVATAVSVVIGTGLTLSYLDAIISIIIETTAFVALVLVIYCAIQLRRLNKAEG